MSHPKGWSVTYFWTCRRRPPLPYASLHAASILVLRAWRARYRTTAVASCNREYIDLPRCYHAHRRQAVRARRFPGAVNLTRRTTLRRTLDPHRRGTGGSSHYLGVGLPPGVSSSTWVDHDHGERSSVAGSRCVVARRLALWVESNKDFSKHAGAGPFKLI
jgi:hypothetical protein